jgi:hypothetical protein
MEIRGSAFIGTWLRKDLREPMLYEAMHLVR